MKTCYKTTNSKQRVVCCNLHLANLRLLFIAFIFLTISGCHKPQEIPPQDKPLPPGDEKLKNPYTVRNMTVAYKNLKTGNAGGRTSQTMEEKLDIRPTH